MFERMTTFSMDRPKTVIGLLVLLTVLFGLQFPSITIDADPENMLETDQADRAYYNQIKKQFGIHDLIVVGVVDDRDIFRSMLNVSSRMRSSSDSRNAIRICLAR